MALRYTERSKPAIDSSKAANGVHPDLLASARLGHGSLHFLPQTLTHVGGNAGVHSTELFAHAVGFGGGQFVDLHALALEVGQRLVGLGTRVLALEVAALLGGIEQHLLLGLRQAVPVLLADQHDQGAVDVVGHREVRLHLIDCLLYTSDAADE